MKKRKWYAYILGASICIFLSVFPLHYFGKPILLFPIPFYIIIENLINIQPILSLAVYILICYILYFNEVELKKSRYLFLNIAITISTLFWFSANLSFGLNYQGHYYFLCCLLINLIFISLLWIDYKINLFNHLIRLVFLTIFLIGYAFPFFGELI